MLQVRMVARNLMDMVASLLAFKLAKLYDNSFICEAIFKSLSPLMKKYVLQLLYVDGPVMAKLLEEWVLPDGVSKHKSAIDRLIQLRVLSETLDRIEYQLPNLIDIVGAITKESLCKAFDESGITSEQDVFEAACDFAREHGDLLWENSKKMRLVVKAETFTQMKEFLCQQKQ